MRSDIIPVRKKVRKGIGFTKAEKLSRHARNRRIVPAINFEARENEYVLKMEVPGFRRHEIVVELSGNQLRIRSRNCSEEWDGKPCLQNRNEYDFHHWKRCISLPDDADSLLVQAVCLNGELEVRIPRGGNREWPPGIIQVPVY